MEVLEELEEFQHQLDEDQHQLAEKEKEEPKTLSQRMKLRLKFTGHHFSKWLNNTSIHGILHVFIGKSRIRRLIWSIIVLIGIIGCILTIGYNISEWASDQTATSVSFQAAKDGQHFPAVTVCNLNAVKKSYSTSEVVELLNSLARPTSHFLLDNPFTTFNKTCNDTLKDIETPERDTTIWEAMTEGSHSIDEFVKYCGFSSSAGQSIIHCEDYMSPVMTSMGLCYTFNGNKNRIPNDIIKRSGPMNGLYLVLNISRLEYSKVTYGNVGIKVLVHHHDELPILEEKGIAIPPGKNAFIGVKTTMHEDDTSENSCLKVSKPLTFLPNQSYSVSACSINQLYENYAQHNICGCALTINRPLDGQFANIRSCTIADICCILNSRKILAEPEDCLPLCNYTSYGVQYSYSQFPSMELAEDLSDVYDYTAEELQSNLVSINVFFDDMKITTSTTQYVYRYTNLLADMGGLMGLFLGASVISLLEVAVLGFDIVKSIVLNKKTKEKVDKIEKKFALPEIKNAVPTKEEAEEEY
jgi:hypothetical protein